MIRVSLSKSDFQYDINSLIKAFYPEETVVFQNDGGHEAALSVDIDLLDEECGIRLQQVNNEPIVRRQEIRETNRKEYKNVLKRLLYNCLSELTGITLPWGTLTGIRPTKLFTAYLESGGQSDSAKQHMEQVYLCSEEKIRLSMDIAKRELQILNNIDYKEGYSIYIGIPFCPTTCLYCSFTSFPMKLYKDLFDDYLDALEKEIKYASECLPNRKINTIYVGGGTPTTLSEDQLSRLLHLIRQAFSFEYVKEFTVEAGRPDSITRNKLKILKDYGVTRISINPQTMNQGTLDLIGRDHTVEQIVNAYHMARELGHNNINMDLIIGLPGEDVASVAHTLSDIDKLGPDSLTVHTLALKRASRLNLNKDEYKEHKAEHVSDMLGITMEYAYSRGYLPYYLYRQKNIADNLENIGYSFPEKEGIYNILIMEERQTILALGAGASSKFVFLDEARIERVENVKNVKEYIARIDEMIQRKRMFIENNFQTYSE